MFCEGTLSETCAKSEGILGEECGKSFSTSTSVREYEGEKERSVTVKQSRVGSAIMTVTTT